MNIEFDNTYFTLYTSCSFISIIEIKYPDYFIKQNIFIGLVVVGEGVLCTLLYHFFVLRLKTAKDDATKSDMRSHHTALAWHCSLLCDRMSFNPEKLSNDISRECEICTAPQG